TGISSISINGDIAGVVMREPADASDDSNYPNLTVIVRRAEDNNTLTQVTVWARDGGDIFDLEDLSPFWNAIDREIRR
ncbi:MAG: hypothetical protein LBG64_02115, partial [Pseudomonadales bacterium]|nr:hypothetical protein [Pseudomonadales bacterium]